ncbi:exo-alpha-sialidase [Tichowtungia aerotolerans]|uniref:Sialidase domain-containing protein n=1 Tax=Tichowtungia aerotolerans TaxID=2697043 RepID=A0A6P1M6C9_9BACT|nr:exo-alpha-sialidase [Tichowtungia aerotolerans]QHI69401.1 hypothetical protein GT409_08025 [Tichowtungia aerotolerans]
MKTGKIWSRLFLCVCCSSFVLSVAAVEVRRVESPAPEAPIRLATGLLKSPDDATWGLPEIPDAEVKTVYRGNTETGTFVNHPQLAVFKDRMYVAFQLCPANEDSSDSVAVYSSSTDLNKWTAPEVIGPPADGHIFRASAGWMQDDDHLYALIIRRDDTGQITSTEYRASTDGQNWSELGMLLPDMMAGGNSRAVTPGGRMLILGHGHHDDEGQFVRDARSYYHDGGDLLKNWKRSVYPQETVEVARQGRFMGREVEAHWFRRPDGMLVLVSRDILRSGYVMAAESRDDGASWGRSLLTNIPDSSNKQCAGSLPDGTCYMITTPGPVEKNDRLQPRTPLVLWLSDDGVVFDRAFLIRRAPAPLRFEGKSKTFGYSYFSSLVHDGVLYIAYATNKEDIEMSCIPLEALERK